MHDTTLLMHGAEDLCTPVSQSTEFYNALIEAGCEAELVVYPREGHHWLERKHQLDAWMRTVEWLNQHCAAKGSPPFVGTSSQ
jgi:dipeptidyl aminopeptidase/acylaminoacyl peptidase